MTIGTALVVIAVLYFIDKYHLWKKAALICLIALGVSLVGAAGYYGWNKWQERKAQAALESQWTIVDPPDWNIPSPPKGYALDDVAYAILFPVKADRQAKTDAWDWYQDSKCVTLGDAPKTNRAAHGTFLFSLETFDDRWLKDTDLPQNVKRALWSAKTRECQLPPGSKSVKACLNRETGGVDDEPWAKYRTDLPCGGNGEVVYLNSESGAK